MTTRRTTEPLPAPWVCLSSWRWKRTDNAAVRYLEQDNYLHAKPWLPGHRGWVAYSPTEEHPLHYRTKRGRYVPVKFKTAAAAMARIDHLYPLAQAAEKTGSQTP